MANQARKRREPLSRMTNKDYNDLTAKHHRSYGKMKRSTGCVGRLSQNDYEKSFNMHYDGLGFNRNKVTSDDIE